VSQLSSPSAKAPVNSGVPSASPKGGLDSLFSPRSVAVIGATDRQGTVGSRVVSNLLKTRLPMKISAVTPSHAEVLGITTQQRIADVSGGVDLAVIVTPARTVPQIVGECVDAGIRNAVVISAGFREQGQDGALLEKRNSKSLAPRKAAVVGSELHGIHESHDRIKRHVCPVDAKERQRCFSKPERRARDGDLRLE
jgi:acetyltransferase